MEHGIVCPVVALLLNIYLNMNIYFFELLYRLPQDLKTFPGDISRAVTSVTIFPTIDSLLKLQTFHKRTNDHNHLNLLSYKIHYLEEKQMRYSKERNSAFSRNLAIYLAVIYSKHKLSF